MNDKKLVIAVDFDGTLCETDFPKIALQTSEQNDLMKKLNYIVHFLLFLFYKKF